jgi:hypothetical protein
MGNCSGIDNSIFRGLFTETQPAVNIVDLIGRYAFGEVRKQ